MMNGYMGPFGGGMMNWGTGGFPGCGGIFGFGLSGLLLIGLALFVLYLFFKNRKRPPHKELLFKNDSLPQLDAKEIARLRYARGEITLEEFQTILKNIQF